jgi:hypothetical protein
MIAFLEAGDGNKKPLGPLLKLSMQTALLLAMNVNNGTETNFRFVEFKSIFISNCFV